MQTKNSAVAERIEADRIVIDANGRFPKLIIIAEKGREQMYRLIKTQFGKFMLTK